VAGRVSVGLPPNIEQADLVSCGIFGLIDVIEKYDYGRGIKFEPYAHLENRLHRIPTDAEVAQQLGISTDEVHHIFNQISFVSVVALDELLTVGSERGDRLSLVDTLEDKTAEDPEAAFESEEMKSILAGAINWLAEREKIVITLHSYEARPWPRSAKCSA
jgi:RNA polymerase sigma factor FliA